MAIVTCCHTQGEARFACAQAGCRGCLEALMQEHAGLVYYIVRQQEIGGVEFQELVQEGRIALWQAILHFDSGRGNTFSSYAWAAIQHQMWHCLGYGNQSRWYREAEVWLASADKIEEEWWRGQVGQALLEVVRKLPSRLRRLVHLAYGLDGQGAHSLAEIGRQWGLSRERVRQLHNNALVLLRLPALSMRLRSLCEQDSRPAYWLARSLNSTWQRSQRRRG